MLDYVQEGLTFLSDLLQSIKAEEVESHSFWMGLDSLLSDGVDLQIIFAGVLECICLKEEVKPSKKLKKGELHVENPLMASIRSLSLKVFYYIMLPLLPTEMDNRFRSSFCLLNGMLPLLLDALYRNVSSINFEDPTQSAQDLQNAVYGSSLLAFVMRFNKQAIPLFMAHPVSESIAVMSKHPLLSVSTCHILHLIVKETLGIGFFDGEKVEILLQVFESSRKIVIDISSPVLEAVPPKGKEGKKDEKGKKNVPVAPVEAVVDPYSQFDTIKLPDLRKHLVQLHVITTIFIELSAKQPTLFEDTHVVRIFHCSKEYLLLERVWEEVCNETKEPFDWPIRAILCEAIGLLGRLSDISSIFAMVLRQQGAISLYLSSLILSSDLYRVNDNHSETLRNSEYFWIFKRQCEKAIFSLMSSKSNMNLVYGRFLSAQQFYISTDEFLSLGDLTEKLNSVLQSKDFDVVMRGIRIVSAMYTALTSTGNKFVLHELQLDKALLGTFCNVSSKLLSMIIECGENDVTPEQHLLDPDLRGSLYLILSTMEQVIEFDSHNVKLCYDKERISMIAKALALFGPANGDMETHELQVKINDPRYFDWQMEKTDQYFDQIYFVRPLLLDFVREIIRLDTKYRVFETPEGASDMDISPSSSPIQEQCHMTVKLTIDIVLQLLNRGTDWKFNEAHQLVAISRTPMLVDNVIIAALVYLKTIGELGPTVVSGVLGEIAITAFSPNWEQSCLRSLISLMQKSGCNDPLESIQFKDCLLFSDFIADPTVRQLNSDFCKSTPGMWPYLGILGPLIAIMGNREANPLVIIECSRAVYSLINCKRLSPSSQHVVMDIMCTIFVLLGGIVQLTGLMGRFSKIKQCGDVEEILTYTLSRGYQREIFWKQWEQDHRVQVQIDPKTGKPIVKKDEKEKKVPPKDKKVDKNAPVEVLVFPEIQFNKESSIDYPDPNRGPACTLWTNLLNNCFSCEHLFSSRICALTCAILGNQSRFLFPFLEFYQEVDINVIDDCGRTPLMYSLLLNDHNAVESLLNKRANLDVVDFNGVPTILYGLSSLSTSCMDSLFPGFCSALLTERKTVRGNCRFLKDLITTGNIDVNVGNLDGCSPLLFSLGEGFIDLSIGGYPFRVFNQAFDHCPTGDSRKEIVQLLVDSGCNVDHCAKNGKVALHIACAEGDNAVMEILLRAKCNPNLVDQYGWHSIHYISACCPLAALDIMDSILSAGNMHPVTVSKFCDYRTGLAEETKYGKELQLYFEDSLTEALQPLSLSAPRAKLGDLLNLLTVEMLTPLLLCCLGSSIRLRNDLNPACDPSVHVRRVQLALRMLKLSQKEACLNVIVTDTDRCPLQLFHALSVLLKGSQERVQLTDMQRRSRRIRYFDCDESELFSLFIENQSERWKPELYCNYPLPSISPFNDKWTPFHPIILNGNVDVLQQYIDVYGLDALAQCSPIAVMCQLHSFVSINMARRLVGICSGRDDWSVHLNGGSALGDYPIHCAISNGQKAVLDALVSCLKVDLNLISKLNGLTPIQAACLSKNVELVNCFKQGAHRVDLTIPLPGGYTDKSLLHWLVKNQDFLMIQMITEMRKMDVLEMLLVESDGTASLLKSLEEFQMGIEKEHEIFQGCDCERLKQILDFFLEMIDSVGGFGYEVHADGFFK